MIRNVLNNSKLPILENWSLKHMKRLNILKSLFIILIYLFEVCFHETFERTFIYFCNITHLEENLIHIHLLHVTCFSHLICVYRNVFCCTENHVSFQQYLCIYLCIFLRCRVCFLKNIAVHLFITVGKLFICLMHV